RNTVVFVTRSSPDPDSTRTAARLSSTRLVCARMSSPPTSSPVVGSSAIWPAQKTKSPATIAWLYGPTGAGARSVRVLRRSIFSPFCQRGGHCARELLVMLRQHAPQVERDAPVHAANGEPGLGSAEELVSAERHHVGPLADRGGDGHLGPETVCRGVEQRSAAEVVDVRNPALARQRRELAPFGPSDEPR